MRNVAIQRCLGPVTAQAVRTEAIAAHQRRSQCLEARATKLRDAGKIADAEVRARALQGIPWCSDPTPSLSPVTERKRARALFVDSVGSASTGDCKTVREQDRQVLTLDAEFHATVFVTDIAIEHCLVSAAAPAPTSQSSPPIIPVQP